MAKSTTQFVCQQCGEDFPKWSGKCPACGEWNSLVETAVTPTSKRVSGSATPSRPIKLSSVKRTEYAKRARTKIGELDGVLGGGIVPGMVALIAGEPGIGKSTLLLQIADNIKGETVYVAGEESASQIASRAQRLGVKNKDILVLEETDIDAVLGYVRGVKKPALLIVDSIQAMTTTDLSGTAGSVGQVRESTHRLTEFAKKTGVPTLIAGHVTKEGSIAGPRVLEHTVDTVLWFEGDRTEFLRILRAVKNRFGATDEVGIFSMTEKGLEEVLNPSKLFLGTQKGVPGSSTTVVMEGTRPLLVEIQALVVPTKLAFPKRVGHGIDSRRLELIVAVLTRRAGLPLWEHDIFVNVVGGMAIREPGADLAMALAIASAFFDKPLLERSVAVGELGLLGEVREVPQLEKRIREARRLGFSKPITCKESRTISQAIKKNLSK